MRSNPYVGPRSFATGERLYGRDRELRRLANLLIAERIVLLYSPSGAGKTSLVQAALIPRLRDDKGFQVLPPIRVGAEPAPDLPGANRYVLSALLSLEGQRPIDQQLSPAELAGMTIDQYIGRITDPKTTGTILIFDQFEEVFSVVPNDREAKEQFFAQVGEALAPRERWALFSMREEYIAQLDRFLREVPTHLMNRFRLDLLEPAGAMAAIQAPARAAGVGFTDEAAQKLIDDLCRVQVQRADGSSTQELGLYVEPVQLQVVCYRLWSQLPEDDDEIGLEDVARIGDVTTALRSYYAERAAKAARSAEVSERGVRDWFDSQLITAQGVRRQVLHEPAASGDLDNRAVAELVDAHLVRAEQIRGATWYELAHDRLIGPVQADNAEWRAANLSQLQRQSAFWEAEGREDGLLLRDAALDEAERWADTHQAALTEVEQEFLKRCHEVQFRNRLIRVLSVAAFAFGVVASVLAFVAFQARGEAVKQARIAESRGMASAALADGDIRPQRSLLLALESQRIGSAYEQIQGEEALQQLLTQVGGQPQQLRIGAEVAAFNTDGTLLAIYGRPNEDTQGSHQIVVQQSDGQGEPISFTAQISGSLISLAISPDGALVGGATSTGDLMVWRSASPQDAPVLLRGDLGSAAPVAFSTDGALLAAGDAGGHISIWRSADLAGPVETAIGDPQPVTALAISPDTQTLAVGYQSGRVDLLSRSETATQHKIFQLHEEKVSAITFSRDGQTIASGSTDSEVLVRTLQSGLGTFLFRGHTGTVSGLQFSADNRQIISSSHDGTAVIWRPFVAKDTPLVLRGHEGWVLDVSFSTRSGEAVTVSRDGFVRRWNVPRPAATPVIHHHSREVASVAYSPDGRWLATGSIDKTVGFWELDGDQVRGTTVLKASNSVWLVAFSADSRLLASANDDGKVQIWQVDRPAAPPAMIDAHPGQIATAVAFSPDGRLASVGYDGALRLWDITQLDNPTLVKEWRSDQPLETVAFSEDGRWLAAAGDAGVIQVWEMADLTAAPQELAAGESYALAFRPGHPGQLVAAGFDANVRLWDLSGPDHTPRTFIGHTDWVISLAFSPDGSKLASASNDDTVRLWDPDQPDLTPLVLRGHAADVKAVDFSYDGRWLASGGLDSTAIIWPMELATLRDRACATAGRNLNSDEIKQIGGQVSARICSGAP